MTLDKLDITIAVVTHNSQSELGDLLESLAPELQAQTIVLDSGSDDTSYLPTRTAQVWRAGNVGYGRSANFGLRQTKTRWMLLANPDARISRESIVALIDVAVEHDATLLAPNILSPTVDPSVGAHYVRLPTPPWRQKQHIDKDRGSIREVAAVQGSILLMDADRVRAIGGFDERFFLYYEEIDLARRLRLAGGTVGWAPSVLAYHAGEMSSTVSSEWRTTERLRGKLMYFYATYGTFDAVCSGLFEFCRIGIRSPKRAVDVARRLAVRPESLRRDFDATFERIHLAEE